MKTPRDEITELKNMVQAAATSIEILESLLENEGQKLRLGTLAFVTDGRTR